VDFDSPLPEEAKISLNLMDKSTPFCDVTGSGIVLVPGKEPPLVLKNLDQSFYVKIKKRGTVLAFPGEETEEIKIKSLLQEPGKILLTIQNNDTTPIVIDSITVFKD
jgi:hypothetical protein